MESGNVAQIQRRNTKEEHGSSYDVFLDSDLFLRWFREAASSPGTGIAREPGSGGYWPARR